MFDFAKAFASLISICNGKESEARQLAKQCRAQPDSGGQWAEYDRKIETEAKQHDAVADLWKKRREFAKREELFVPTDDIGFLMEPRYQELIMEAQSAGLFRTEFTGAGPNATDFGYQAKQDTGTAEARETLDSFTARDTL